MDTCLNFKAHNYQWTETGERKQALCCLSDVVYQYQSVYLTLFINTNL